MQIEEIEFKSGTSEFMEGSEPKLRRLRDFMALNSDVSVEIQGHVFATGDNSIAAQKISEARAKRVMQYLITQGIDKSRMTAIGYGNTKPVYANPKFAYEEQANRRVEIQVK
jgi:outer membrane protein OmpA-like peptidoglycan-associated protein